MPPNANHLSRDLKLIGDFYAVESAVVEGQVEGHFTVEGMVKVTEEGRIQGKITVGGLEIAPGGRVKGHLQIKAKKSGLSQFMEVISPGKETLARGFEELTKFAMGKK